MPEGQNSLGATGLGPRLGDNDRVSARYQQAVALGADVRMALTQSKVALSFTLADPDGNEWWINAETGFLDQLREAR